MKHFPKMTQKQHEALLKATQRREHAEQEVETAEWGQARFNARGEALNALLEYLDNRPFRVFYSEREVLARHIREHMEEAQWSLVQRILKFRDQGKDTIQITEQYLMVRTSGLLRCVVEVDGQPYGWYKYWAGPWETGDRLVHPVHSQCRS